MLVIPDQGSDLSAHSNGELRLEFPGVASQGRTKAEAREMVLDALGGMLGLRAAAHQPQGKSVGSESLNIVAV